MNKTTLFSSARFWPRAAALALLLLLVLSVAACGAEPTPVAQAPTAEEATEAEPTAAPTDTEAPAPTDTVAPTDTPAPTEPPPTPTATPAPIDDTGCITCHTSEETLQAMATEEEAPEVESEGEG
jgi:hypothetical protein